MGLFISVFIGSCTLLIIGVILGRDSTIKQLNKIMKEEKQDRKEKHVKEEPAKEKNPTTKETSKKGDSITIKGKDTIYKEF